MLQLEVRGICAGCDREIYNDEDGITIAADGSKWHPDCRRVELRKKQDPPRRGPGRPRKEPEA